MSTDNRHIVLDMDNTLIHAVEIQPGVMYAPKPPPKPPHTFQLEPTGFYALSPRPHLESCLRALQGLGTLHLYSAGQPWYIKAIVDTLELDRYFGERVYSTRGAMEPPHEEVFDKFLRETDIPILVDDAPVTASGPLKKLRMLSIPLEKNFKHHIEISCWTWKQEKDFALLELPYRVETRFRFLENTLNLNEDFNQ